LLLFDSGKEDLFETIEKKQAKRERFLKRMKSRGKWKHGKSNVEKVRRLKEARALARARAKIFPYSDYLGVVIALSTGSTKKKPMTKKEREEKRRKHKEKRLKK
jgi:hypothetical protein